jgi:hypothetical protein
MKTTIAHKNHGAGITYILLTVFALPFLVSALIYHSLPYAILGLCAAILGGWFTILYLSLPSAIIVLSEGNTLILPKRVIVPLEAIYDVSYRRARAKRIQYRWGKIILETRLGRYKFNFVSDCEEVAKHLTRLIYEAKYCDTETRQE